MKTLRGSLACLETNILLSATNRARSDYQFTRAVFQSARAAGCHLAISGQILHEYLVVATRPPHANGFGLDTQSALRNVEWFRSRMVFLEETEEVLNTLQQLISGYHLTGKRIHDANIAALALVHRAYLLITLNTDDFAEFDQLHVAHPDTALDALQ